MKEFLLSELLQIKNGRDYKHLSKGPYPVFGSGGLMQYVDDYLYDKPSILLPRKGSLTNIQYADVPFWTVDTLYYTEVDNSKVNAYYLYYYLKQLDLSNLDSGTGVPSMTFDSYYNIRVSLPPLTEQDRIAILLQKLDKAVAVKRQINDYLEAMARQLYDYWFVQFDFPDESGNPYKSTGGKMVWNDTLKREIPEGWSNGVLGDYIGRITNGLNPRSNFILGNGNNYYITIRSLTGTDIDWDNCDKCDDVALRKINSRSQLQIGDIVFSAIGTIGRTYLIQEQPRNWNISETSFTLRPTSGIPSEFLYSLLRSDEIQLLADKAAMGSTLRCLVMESLKQVPIVLIPEFLTKRFGGIVKTWYSQIYSLNKQVRELREQRDSIMPLLTK